MVDDERDIAEEPTDAPKAPKASKVSKAPKVPKAAKAPKLSKAHKKSAKENISKKSEIPKVLDNPEPLEATEVLEEPEVLYAPQTPIDPELATMNDAVADAHLDVVLDVANVTYQLLWRAADFHILLIRPTFDVKSPPYVYSPEPLEGGGGLEHVYPIVDFGFMLSTSRGEEMYVPGMSMNKMHNTIEKMVVLLIEKLKAQEGSGEIDASVEIQVAFDGFILAKRKAFESIINLPYNVVVTNFDPGAWGERYLDMVKRMADKYGYPTETPRPDVYRQAHHEVKRPSRS